MATTPVPGLPATGAHTVPILTTPTPMPVPPTAPPREAAPAASTATVAPLTTAPPANAPPAAAPAASTASTAPPYPYLTMPRPSVKFTLSVQQASAEAAAAALLANEAFVNAAAAATHAACMADQTAEKYGNLSTALSGT